MRRVFIIRKDLNLSSGKLAAMVSHCAEAYWTNAIRRGIGYHEYPSSDKVEQIIIEVDKEILEQYVNGIFTKTICEARNLNQLKKVTQYVEEINSTLSEGEKLVEGVDYGWINDSCLTELKPENEDGTCTVGIWFKPLPDEIAHKISKKYPLYRDHS